MNALHPGLRIEQLVIFIQCKPVSHPSDVVTDDPLRRITPIIVTLGSALNPLINIRRKDLGILHVGLEEGLEDPLGLVGHPLDPVVAVHLFS